MRMVNVWCLAKRTNLKLVGQWCTVRAPPPSACNTTWCIVSYVMPRIVS